MRTLRNLFPAFLSLALLFTLAACDSSGAGDGDGSTTNNDGEDLELVGPTWTLVSFVGPNGATPVFEGDTYRVQFQGGGELDAGADCNSCPGTYTSSAEGDLSIESLQCTEVFCVDSQADRFLEAFYRATSYTVSGSELRITHGEGQALRFEAGE